MDAERRLEAGAQQIAAGSISAVRGELDLIQTRIRRHLHNTGGVDGEIQRSVQSATNEGKLRLKQQRIKFENASEVARLPPSVNDAGQPDKRADVAVGTWQKYGAWFEANLKSLEGIAARARAEPRHYALDEQDALKLSTATLRERFDVIAQEEYQRWLESDSAHEVFSAQLLELRAQVLKTSLQLWSVGSDVLRQWYEKFPQRDAESALTGHVKRWEHRALTTEIVQGLSRDRGLALASIIKELDALATEEAREVPVVRERLQVWVHPTSHHFDAGFSGDFLERVRGAIVKVGLQLRPPASVPPLELCLQTLLRELVCERHPLNNPRIARLNKDQRNRYTWAPTSGDSITPDSGQILNVCEALRWYCHRLMGLLDSPDVVLRIKSAANSSSGVSGPLGSTQRRGRLPNQKRRDALHKAIAKHGNGWRDHLSDIFKELDEQEVPMGDYEGYKIDFGDGQNQEASKWDDLDLATDAQRRKIIDFLRKYAK